MPGGQADLTGSLTLEVNIIPPLTGVGGTSSLSGNEGVCQDALCSVEIPERYIAAGAVQSPTTSTPEPASIFLFGSMLTVLYGALRRKLIR